MYFDKLFYLTVLDFGIQWALWAIAAPLKTEKFYDLAGASTFILLSLLSYFNFSSGHPRAKIQTAAIVIWAARLGVHLFSRILKQGNDRRFKRAKEDPKLFFVFWTLQGFWVLSTLFPTLLMMLDKTRKQPQLNAQDILGWIMWLVGFAMEALADYQKSRFTNNPANKDKFINTGLWSLSRHPNYFGEILLWFGLFVSASSTFTHWWEYLSVLSPTFVALLLTRVSGIPMLEEYGMKKWGGTPDYQIYLRDTPVLIPKLFA